MLNVTNITLARNIVLKADSRRQKIVELLVTEGSASLNRLAQHFDVSIMTIHRDLDALESQGLLRKQRGGATVKSSLQFESDFRYRVQMSANEKRSIAQRAAEFIEPGMSVMLDDGSTSLAIAPFLIDKAPLTIITNNLSVISDLGGITGITVLALGGTYSKKFNGFFGILTESAIDDLRADVAFLSSSAADPASAFHQDLEVVAVKRRMIKSSARRYLIVDHHKFERTALYFLAKLSEFDGVITNRELTSSNAEALQNNGISLYYAGDN